VTWVYEQRPDDPRFIREYGATQSIATSNGQSDSGLFQLSFNDDRYLPFEFAGAMSRWQIEIPPENNEFDLSTLTDVVMQLNYTSRDGGEATRRAATRAAQRHLSASGWRLIDFARDLSAAWSRYLDKPPRGFCLVFNRSMSPYLRGHRDLHVVALGFFLVVPCAEFGEHLTIKFDAKDTEISIVCVSDPAFSGLYQCHKQLL